ncbi:MAG: serine hydrolase domain-containing protein [Mycobacteriales bacterium]
MDAGWLTGRLTELAQKYDAPGASVAVLAGGEVTEAATGVLNLDTGVAATPDSLFQIGSITKVWTATAIMRLVEQGKLTLDTPVASVLPEFAVADPTATRTVTIRQLLAHTSGIDGDHFHDTGRGDECLERYVASCAQLEQKYPPGATMSYCNAGYSILGRILEVLTGKVWDDAIRDLLITPLGLTHTVTLPEEALRFRAAMGHMGEPGARHPAPAWGLMRSAGPAGLICATGRDLLRFAQLHLDGGVAAGGERLLSAETVAAMAQPQVKVPDRWTLGDAWGLGWILFDWDGVRLIGHDGATLGQNAFLRIVPEAGVAVTLLTNGGGTGDLFRTLVGEILQETAGVSMPAPLEPVEKAVDATRYAGRYVSASVTLEITPRGSAGLTVTITNTSELAALMDEPTQELEALPAAPEDVFVTRLPGSESWTPVVFFTLPEGGQFVHFGARATRRVD